MCLTSPAVVVRVDERGGITVIRVSSPDEGQRDCITYVDGLAPGDRVLIAGGAIVERFEEEAPGPESFADLLIQAFDATHPGGTTV